MKVSIWLVPAAPHGSALDAAIAAYAASTGKASFPPHLTLAGGPAADAPDLAPLQAFAPVVLARSGVLATPSFTRSFALRFSATPALIALREAARAALAYPQEPAAFDPHVSVTYGAVPDPEPLHAISDRFSGDWLFDRVCAISHDAVETQDDVRAWRFGPVYALSR